MAKEKMLSMTDFAKSRGMTMKDIKKAIKDEIISDAVKLGRNDRKLILVDKANALLDEHLGIEKPQEFERHAPGSGHRDGSMMVDETSIGAYSKARAVKETMAAKTAQVKYEQLTGSLVDADEVRSAAKIVGLNLRNSLLNLPNKLAPILAAETDVLKAKRILEDEIRSALENLSRGDYDFLGEFGSE